MRKSAAPECGHGFNRGLVEAPGGNANGVLDAVSVGEGDEAGADGWHGFLIGEGKANIFDDRGRSFSIQDFRSAVARIRGWASLRKTEFCERFLLIILPLTLLSINDTILESSQEVIVWRRVNSPSR